MSEEWLEKCKERTRLYEDKSKIKGTYYKPENFYTTLALDNFYKGGVFTEAIIKINNGESETEVMYWLMEKINYQQMLTCVSKYWFPDRHKLLEQKRKEKEEKDRIKYDIKKCTIL
jgi:hypothetical protein